MKNWRNILVSPEAPIVEALKVLDQGSLQIVLVVNEDRKLLGTLTDGDVRTGILGGVSLQSPVRLIMRADPVTAKLSDDADTILTSMRSRDILQIPLVDDAGRVIGLHNLKDLLAPKEVGNWVVLMAGGLGTRLAPLTRDCPKPLLAVGDKPILEIILDSFMAAGFRRFSISVNYRADMIERYFGDGSKWGVHIDYLRETERMGTAGALSLLPERPQDSVIVMNGDILTKVNFAALLQFHTEHQADATLCVRQFDLQVPYGVVRLDGHAVIGIDEKPIHKSFINAGIYVLSPSVFAYLETGRYLDMPDLFELLMRQKFSVAAFPLREYWLDIGRMEDFVRANGDYALHFTSKSK